MTLSIQALNTADQHAEAEYIEFNKTQHIESDFDRLLKELKVNNETEC